MLTAWSGYRVVTASLTKDMTGLFYCIDIESEPDDFLDSDVGSSNEVDGIHLLFCLQRVQPPPSHLLLSEEIACKSGNTAGKRVVLLELMDGVGKSHFSNDLGGSCGERLAVGILYTPHLTSSSILIEILIASLAVSNVTEERLKKN